jgi:hypothetical protein
MRVMRLVTMSFATPLLRAEASGAQHVGTGGYVDEAGRRLLLTNDHVVGRGAGRSPPIKGYAIAQPICDAVWVRLHDEGCVES